MEKILRLHIFQQFLKLGWNGIFIYLKIIFQRSEIVKVYIRSSPFPVYIRRNTSDVLSFLEVFGKKVYDIECRQQPKFIIDCGANVGYASVFFKIKFPEATVIAIEPEASNFKMLQKNLLHFNNTHLLHNAIWNCNIQLEIVESPFGKWAYSTNEITNQKENMVDAITIANIMKQFSIPAIDILKIDIEGSEKELFEKNYESWLAKTKIIIIELHDAFRQGAASSFFKAISNFDFTMSRKESNYVCHIKNEEQ